MYKIAAIIVTFNRLELLKQCVESIKVQSLACDILIVNNCSTDNTEAWALEQVLNNNRVFYKNTGSNIGGAGGFNFGVRWAIESNYDYIWLMDDDCLPYENALEELIKVHCIMQGKYGWLSSTVLWKDGHECNMNRPKLKKSFYDYLEYIQYGIVQAEQATFVSLFLKTDTVKEFGLPIKEFFIWGDDIEFTRRISVINNIPCFLVGKSKVLHAMANNCGSSIATDAPERIHRYKYAFRNENYLYRKEGLVGIAYYIAKCGVNILRIITKAPNNKIYRCSIILGCMVKGLFFNPKIEYIKK